MLKKSLLILTVLTASTSANAAVKQNSQEAQKFFQNQLEFLTNIYNVNQVVEGKVQNVAIIDVRAAEDYRKGHIPGAINIPYDKYQGFQGPEKDFPGLTKEGYNYIYCYTAGCNLAAKAAVKFASLGYAVKEIHGGFEGWQNEGKTIEQ